MTVKQTPYSSHDTLRFKFGANWVNFLKNLNDERIQIAEQSLKDMLKRNDLKGLKFLDIGSGSGLFSLCARRLGATVYSFDYDTNSVECTRELKNRYFPNDKNWTIEQGSALDQEYLKKLGQFDVIYSWGVLHHTGNMWQALECALVPAAKKCQVAISIYNDQGRPTRNWTKVKKLYNALPKALRFVITIPCLFRLWFLTWVRDLLKFGDPRKTWQRYRQRRGMSAWHDVIDWIGGYPFEVAKPEEIFEFYHSKGYQLTHLKTCGKGHGCNEFVFEK